MWTSTAGCNSTLRTSITGRCGSISRSFCAPFPSFFPDAVHTRGCTNSCVRVEPAFRPASKRQMKNGRGGVIAQYPAPQGRNNTSPGRKPWVKWEKLGSPFRDGTVLTHPLQARTTYEWAYQSRNRCWKTAFEQCAWRPPPTVNIRLTAGESCVWRANLCSTGGRPVTIRVYL